MQDVTTRLWILTACVLVILIGASLIPYAGVQNDEALFANPLYQQITKDFRIRLFHHDIPIMVMSYVGTLKTMLYWPLFAVFGTGVWTVRLPMVLAAALTVFSFFYLALLSSGRETALMACLLLATDPTFLLSNTFDWGPVALEHLLLVTGCFFLVHFAQTAGRRDLFLGFFLLGLALWNKAIFLWALAGLVAGGLAVFWPELRRFARPQNITLAAGAFLAGALPFVIYNVHRPNATLKSNAHFDTHVTAKFVQVRNALAGDGLFGYIAGEEWEDRPKAPASRRGRAALWVREHLGEHRRNGMEYAFGIALVAVPLWWRSRAARFSLVFLLVAWLAMAVTRDAGSAIHHTVLLWPFPHLFVAASACRIRWRPAPAAVTIVLVGMNLLVINQYVVQFERDGAEGSFTDAIYPLSRALPEIPGQTIYILDWGMQNTLDLFHHGRLRMRSANEPFMTDSPSEGDRQQAGVLLSDPNGLFVGHVEAREEFKGVGARLNQAALGAGYRKELLQTIPDSNGRAVFEIFRFRKGSGVLSQLRVEEPQTPLL